MGRKAVIIGVVEDHWRNRWEYRRFEPIPRLGFGVYQGWPEGLPRGGGGCGGPRWIVTTPLAEWYIANADVGDPDRFGPLPWTNQVVKRHRKMLGIDRFSARFEWWQSRIGDLLTLTIPDFSRIHGVSEASVDSWRRRLACPRRQNPDGWYLEPEHAERLRSHPPSWLADYYGLSVRSIHGIRWTMRKCGVDVPDLRGRVDTTRN